MKTPINQVVLITSLWLFGIFRGGTQHVVF